ncbi:hypothetical protein CC78DRAFT_568040 [Lojkania enalia]|uniref:Uncharacterized protein n=1 Tax=Lojkania enalia TaxID=147567 RepID=A0A9P4KBM9_9PLEO|nr:hypothetical protein CC78DRAFT_568040 [Didymosphaeria enalia]
MLSQRQHSLGVGRDSGISLCQYHLLDCPPQPQAVSSGISPALQHQLGRLYLSAPKRLKRNRTTAREHGFLRSTPNNYLRQATTKVGRRGMMRTTTSSTPPPPPRTIHFQVPTPCTLTASFTFVPSPQPGMVLLFPPRPAPIKSRKRCRALADVDGELSSLQKKKRRLRLFLITSRLSPEFSSPATNIVDRGTSKIAVWAKQKALGRNLLRKAAILNLIRRRAFHAKETDDGLGGVLVEQEREQKQLQLAKLAFMYGSHDTHTRPVLQRTGSVPLTAAVRIEDHFELSGDPDISLPRRSPSPSPSDTEAEESTYRSPNEAYSYLPPHAQIPRRLYLPLPPSPLGLSNYDAFDLEDDIPDPYAHLDDDDQSAEQNEDIHDTDPRSPSANTSASYASTLSTAATGNSEALRTPSQMIYSDFNILDPGEPVIGDYDQVDDGADAVWPNATASEPLKGVSGAAFSSAQPVLPASSSPNFTALLATSKDEALVPGQISKSAFQALGTKDNEIAKEKERQKSLMFLQFG